MLLRPYQDGDGPGVRALVEAVLQEFGFEPDPRGLDADVTDVGKHYMACGGHFAVLTGEREGIRGTVGLVPRGPGVLELKKMYLAPEVRGLGQGRRLLEHALEWARAHGYRRIELETDAVFERALALYQRYGFVPVGDAGSCSPCDRRLALDL